MSYEKLSKDLRDRINSELKRDIMESEADSVETISDLSESDIRDLRVLNHESALLSVAFLRYKLRGMLRLDAAISFNQVVIEGMHSVQEWLQTEAKRYKIEK